MGTEILILFPIEFENKSKNKIYLVNEIKKIFENSEEIFSRFRKNSFLSELNEKKFLDLNEKNFFDAKKFFEVFQLSKKIFQETNWAFNPLLSVKKIWYYKNFEEIKKIQNNKINKTYNSNFSDLSFENLKLELKKWQELDFWWIVKWWTVDQSVKFLLEKWIKDFLINAWWDIFAVWKANLNENIKNQNWKIEIEKTWQIVELKNQAIASSWKSKRFWFWKNWEKFNHIINKNTQNSSENKFESISVIDNSCAEADAWATAGFSLWEIEWQNILINNQKKYYLNF